MFGYLSPLFDEIYQGRIRECRLLVISAFGDGLLLPGYPLRREVRKSPRCATK